MQFIETIARRYFSAFGISVLSLEYNEREDHLPRVMVRDCNNVFLDFFDLQRYDVIGKPLSVLFKDESYCHALQYMYMSMKLNKHGSAALPLKDGQGRQRHMEIEFFPLSEITPVEARKEALWCWIMRPAKT